MFEKSTLLPPSRYTIRRGTFADTAAVTDVYTQAFAADQFTEVVFPDRARHPGAWETHVYRIFEQRYWTLGWELDVLVDRGGEERGEGHRRGKGEKIVGFAYWKKPREESPGLEGLFTFSFWISVIMILLLSLKSTTLPLSLDLRRAKSFQSLFETVIPPLLAADPTGRRPRAWYLSSFGLLPSHQHRGLGTILLDHGLRRIDVRGKGAWLISVAGKDTFYERFGFREGGRVNVGDFSQWEGGAVMFRE